MFIRTTYLWFALPTEADGNDSQDGGGAEVGSGRNLPTFVSLNKPKCDPWTHHNQRKRSVDLKKEVAGAWNKTGDSST